MADKKEIKKLLCFVKKLSGRRLVKKIKKVVDSQEKIEVAKYSIRTKLELKLYELEKEIKKKEEKEKDMFLININLRLLKSKIMLFEATYHKKDFDNMIKLFKEIKKQVKHV